MTNSMENYNDISFDAGQVCMVEYNFSSDTRQDKNDGSQYGELQLYHF